MFISCSSDDNEPIQDYTTFTVTINSPDLFKDCVAGYKINGKYKKLGNLGDLKEGIISPEIKITDNSITEIYIWGDWGGMIGIVRLDDIYVISKNKKNSIVPTNNTKGIQVTDKTDPTQYPQ